MFNAEKLLFVGRIDSISESGIKDSLVWLNFWYNYAELETRVNAWQQHLSCEGMNQGFICCTCLTMGLNRVSNCNPEIRLTRFFISTGFVSLVQIRLSMLFSEKQV